MLTGRFDLAKMANVGFEKVTGEGQVSYINKAGYRLVKVGGPPFKATWQVRAPDDSIIAFNLKSMDDANMAATKHERTQDASG